MGCNKNAIRVRVNPWNINSTQTMYAQYYALEFNIILNLTSPIKVYVIWIIYSYDLIIIYDFFFFFFLKLFQQPCFSIFLIWTSMFHFTHWLCLVAMRRKFYNLIQCKDILDPPSHYININGCAVKWFLEHNNELVCVQTLMPIFPDKIYPLDMI